MSDSRLTASRWDDEYRNERYANEPPLRSSTAFSMPCAPTPRPQRHRPVRRMAATAAITCRSSTPGSICSGSTSPRKRSTNWSSDDRRYRAAPALRRLPQIPESPAALRLPDRDPGVQHGADADVATYFREVGALLRPGGLFFLRVNSARTQIYHAHSVVAATPGAVSRSLDDGPKSGLLVTSFPTSSCGSA